MNINKAIMFLLLGMYTVGSANQINMSNVRKVTAPMKSENNDFSATEEQDLDEPIDFETEGELDMKDLKSPEWLIWFNKHCIAPFFGLYNWFQQKAEVKRINAQK